MYISPHEQFTTASNDSRTIEVQQQPGAGRGHSLDTSGAPPRGLTRTRVRPTRHRLQQRKSLQTTETTSNTVRNDIARATTAPRPKADGPPANERAPAPL
jgi:hypothetical protein